VIPFFVGVSSYTREIEESASKFSRGEFCEPKDNVFRDGLESTLGCGGLSLGLELFERFLLDLSNPFPRNAKAVSNFFQCIA